MKTPVIRNIIAAFFLLSFFSTLSIADQAETRASLFSDADYAYRSAQGGRADILAPKTFAAGKKLYEKADDRFKAGKSIEKIRSELKRATQYFNQSLEALPVANLTLGSALQARNDAEAVQAVDFASELWKTAEDSFYDAARAVENGDLNKGKKYAAEAEKEFREAELEAIKTNYLDPSKRLIGQAKEQDADEYAPKTLALAESLVNEAESSLIADRYDTDKPRALAKQARYQAKRAIYLTRIAKALDKEDVSAEKVLTEFEKPLVAIAGALDLEIYLDEGSSKPTQLVLAKIENLLSDSRKLVQQSERVRQLEEETDNLQGRLGIQSANLEKQEANRRRLENVEALFLTSEATVLTQGSNIIVRAYGLNFSSGSAQINSTHFPLLRKILAALDYYPNASLVIEGHTDSFGSDASNLSLSTKRADAVQAYLLANRGPNDKRHISAEGYGESRPIANNETAEGRQKNRRIDFLIIPHEVKPI